MTLVATLNEFKDQIKFPLTNTAQDTKLTSYLTAASEWAQWRLSGPLAQTTFTERLYCNGSCIQQQHHPLVSVTSITPQDGTALPATAYIVDTTNSQIEMRGAYYGWHTVVYVAGPASVLDHVKRAGLIVAQHLWTVENGSAGRGQQQQDLVPTPFGFAVPARAEELIGADPNFKDMPGFA